jgi:L-aspartate oxidase
MGADDQPWRHAEDTVEVSAGLAVRSAVEALTDGGREAIDRLVAIGANFDRNRDGTLRLGQEAGHGRRRIVHADGDATGAEIMRALVGQVRGTQAIEVVERVLAIDLVLSDGNVCGVVVMDDQGRTALWRAPAVVLATGGIGQLYARTTNPVEATGDGIAMAARAGADLIDMEFVQFHPTALDTGGDPMPLLTEALRGDGARLVNSAGDRFMRGVHPDAELAPRDIVARTTYERRGDAFLDATVIGDDFEHHYPTVFASAARAGLDPRKDLLPVSPAAHYSMGGIAADQDGRTSLRGLFAVGECASTGVHGGNRLASNSLLEGLVFGKRAAATVQAEQVVAGTTGVPTAPPAMAPGRPPEMQQLRDIMWEHVGVVRSEASLVAARQAIARLAADLERFVEGRNAVTVAHLVIDAAMARTETRGAHARSDYPNTDDALAVRQRIRIEPRFDALTVAV